LEESRYHCIEFSHRHGVFKKEVRKQ